MKVTYTLVLFRPTPEDPVMDGLPLHYLFISNQNMWGGGPNKPQIPKHPGISRRDRNKTVSFDCQRSGLWWGRGGKRGETPLLLGVNEKPLFLGLIFESRSLAWPSHLGSVLFFFFPTKYSFFNITIQRSGEQFLKKKQ